MFGKFCKTQKFVTIVTTAESLTLYRITVFHVTFAQVSRLVKGTGLDRCWGLQKFQYFKIYRQSAHKRGKVISPLHWFSFLLEAQSKPGVVVWPVRLNQQKFSMNSSGIKPANFRLVVQCLNQLRHRVMAGLLVYMIWSQGRVVRRSVFLWCPLIKNVSI
jgi:hypothetical protein